MRRRFVMLVWVAILVICRMPAGAREYRASVTGAVTDPSKAVVVGAIVTIHNQATGVETTTKSDSTGSYVLNFIDPGTYILSAEANGFRRWEKHDLRLDTAQEVKVNITLKLSEASSTVTVEAGTPALETANANISQLFDTRDISGLPIADGNPTQLLQLVGGSINTGNPIYSRVFDIGAITTFRVNGTPGASSYYLNGVPANATTGGAQAMAIVPPSEAIDQVNVSTLWFNGSDGNTAAANFNFNTKSGTNQPHGSVYEYFENSYLNGRTWHEEELNQAKPAQRSNHFGGTFGGPVVIPHAYDGRSKTFFFAFLDEVRDTLPRPTSYEVPTLKMRTGDLSEVCTSGFTNGLCNTANQQVYNPFSATATSDGHVIRQPFLNNQIPASLLSTFGQKVLSLYPQPNIPGGTVDGTPNFYSPNSDTDTYYAWMVRGDHHFTNDHHLAMDYFQSNRKETSGVAPNLGSALHPGSYNYELINHGFGITDTIALTANTVLDARLGFNRFEQFFGPLTVGYDLSSLGFSSKALAEFHGTSYLPIISSADLSTISSTPYDRALNQYSAAASLTKSVRNHLIKFGYDGRLYRTNYNSTGNNNGNYTFNGSFASQTDTSTTQYGMGITDLLVGQPTAGSIDVNASYAAQIFYHSAFLQDEWNVTPKLSIAAGLRYEFEGAPTDRYNRNTRGFDLTSANPTQSAAQGAFTSAFPGGLDPGLGLPVKTDFSVLGGYTWADSTHRGFFNADKKVFLPRMGLAYALREDTVIRTGAGLYKIPLSTANAFWPAGNQTGFSQTTNLTPTTDNGLTFAANISNPFPNGVVQPTGTSLGLYQNLGAAATYFPVNPLTQYAAHWTAEVQHAFLKKWVADVVYLGSKGWNIGQSSNIEDAVPQQYFSTSPTRDTALINAMTRTVSNPFYGLLGSTSQNSTALNTGSTVQVQQLLRPRPQFTGITSTVFNSSDVYHSLNTKVVRRFADGYSFTAVYTWSKLLERSGFNNDFQVLSTKALSSQDVPQRFTATFVGELPFGRERHWLNSMPLWADMALGGWQASGSYGTQSGYPLDFGNVFYSGDPRKLHFKYDKALVGTGTPMIDISGFYLPTDANGNAWTSADAKRADSRIQLSNNVRYMPRYMGNTRAPGQRDDINLAITKKFQLSDRVSTSVRASFINAFNTSWWTNPYLVPSVATFGTLDGNQSNNPRYIQLNARINF
ncbi:carboxypeptidase regulatory-like domain-containing protein [Silvibacterium acidisoli]|uniref:carboxypeptidase regulatory-like domain-containing protein n=1 Tax=Acidobacteriaceae bacterium ZG23-2 TaxID=2883246 RepID=UPI00406CDA1E